VIWWNGILSCGTDIDAALTPLHRRGERQPVGS